MKYIIESNKQFEIQCHTCGSIFSVKPETVYCPVCRYHNLHPFVCEEMNKEKILRIFDTGDDETCIIMVEKEEFSKGHMYRIPYNDVTFKKQEKL